MWLGEIEFHLLRESTVWFDGGAMFGHVPRVVWERLATPDAYNRLPVACNSLLVRTGGKNVIIEAGMGLKWGDKERELYHLEAHSFDELLAPHGLTPAEIDLVIVSHLHIDHAGGLTTWDAERRPRLTFPNATVIAQLGEWEAANNPDLRSRPSYRAHDFLPVHEAGKLQLIQGPRPILPGIETIVTGGHTKWHQIVKLTSAGETLYYLADILPSSLHLKPHWVMGYDLYPTEVMASRSRLLPLLQDPKVICVFGHDPVLPVARVVAGEKAGLYKAVAVEDQR